MTETASTNQPAKRTPADSSRIGELQARREREEFRDALRALLMCPLMSPGHEAFGAVRRQADRLREWFMREAGWPLQVERDGSRLAKRAADLDDATRGLPNFDRRRYVLLCLACAALERADAQITLHLLGERVMALAAEPALATGGFAFSLRNANERRELVVVCRTLLQLGVLARVAGDEERFVADGGAGLAQADALYDVSRRLLAGMLAMVRGPSTWAPEEAPTNLQARLVACVSEYVIDSDQGRRDVLRHHLARRLLDDPVVYADTLEPDLRAYFSNQRGPLASRLAEASGLIPEQRAEGLALTDDSGKLTDVTMPAEGTEAHVTLLVAEFLAQTQRRSDDAPPVTEAAIEAFLRTSVHEFGRFWRKSARQPGAERELAQIAIARLACLQLVRREDGAVHALPAVARFALGAADVAQAPTGRVGKTPQRKRKPDNALNGELF